MITRQWRGFVLSVCPSLALEREREKESMKKEIDEEEKEEESYLSLRVLHPFIPDCLGDLLAQLVYPDPPLHRLFTVP